MVRHFFGMSQGLSPSTTADDAGVARVDGGIGEDVHGPPTPRRLALPSSLSNPSKPPTPLEGRLSQEKAQAASVGVRMVSLSEASEGGTSTCLSPSLPSPATARGGCEGLGAALCG